MTRVETVTLEREVLVPVPEGLTEEVEVPRLPPEPDTLALGATYKATVIRLKIANGKLAAIRNLNPNLQSTGVE